MAAIKFGTDGWRARIAEDFTFANVEILTQALVDYLKTQNAGGELRTVVGYDRRFASELFARRAAEVLAGNGVAESARFQRLQIQGPLRRFGHARDHRPDRAAPRSDLAPAPAFRRGAETGAGRRH